MIIIRNNQHYWCVPCIVTLLVSHDSIRGLNLVHRSCSRCVSCVILLFFFMIFISLFLRGSTKSEADVGSINYSVCSLRILLYAAFVSRYNNVKRMNRSISLSICLYLCLLLPKIENNFDNKFLKAILRVLIICEFSFFFSLVSLILCLSQLVCISFIRLWPKCCCRWCSSLIFCIVRSLLFQFLFLSLSLSLFWFLCRCSWI